MQEVFEKIIEKLEEENRRLKSLRNNCIALSDSEVNAIENKAYNFSIEIVKQEAEKYNNGYGTDGGVRMSKAVLVMDMPEKCEKCPLKTLYGDAGYYVCEAGRYCGKKWGRVDLSSKPDWCPLRPMPEKKQEEVPVAYTHFGAYIDGWNACIDAIGGVDGE